MKDKKKVKEKHPIVGIVIAALVLSGVTALIASISKGFTDWTIDLELNVDESNRLKVSDFQTNDVETSSDLIEGNIYHIDITLSEGSLNSFNLWAYYVYNGSISKYQDKSNWSILMPKVPLLQVDSNNVLTSTITFYKMSGGKIRKTEFENNLRYTADFVYASGGLNEDLISCITKCPGAIES